MRGIQGYHSFPLHIVAAGNTHERVDNKNCENEIYVVAEEIVYHYKHDLKAHYEKETDLKLEPWQVCLIVPIGYLTRLEDYEETLKKNEGCAGPK